MMKCLPHDEKSTLMIVKAPSVLFTPTRIISSRKANQVNNKLEKAGL